MTYKEHILSFPEQLKYQPQLINKEKIREYKHIVIAGMGGSRLAPDILSMLNPELDIHIYSSSNLPDLSSEYLSESLIIANSHSGNTQETISFAKAALDKNYNLAVITTGGELKQFAEKKSLPHIITPTKGEPARLGIGSNLIDFKTILGLFITTNLNNMTANEEVGKKLANILAGGIPVIYASEKYNELGYIWKIILNETAKVPAFCNRYPEIFHNEIVGFDSFASNFRWVLIHDSTETDTRVQALGKFLSDKGLSGTYVELKEGPRIEKIMSSIVVAHFAALALAEKKNVDPASTPSIDEFKKLA
jgi:glucose/mannose-6-phosphate isomerase